MENQVRELLRDIADDIPPQREVPPTLRPRARRRIAVTVGMVVLLVGALALGGVEAVRSISGSSPQPADRGPTVAPSPLGAGEILTVLGRDLVAQDPDSGKVRTIVDAGSLPAPDVHEEITGAAWSHDRAWVAFRRGPGSQAGELWVADTAGGSPRQLATDVGWSPWAWSPTEDQLVLVRGRDVTLIDAATGRETDLGTTVGAKDSEGYAVHALTWSPDGTEIAYDGGPGSGSVYVIDPQSGEHALLVRQPTGTGAVMAIDWSPDGAHLAITYANASRDGSTAVYLANADGSDLRLVDHNDTREWPVWHPGMSVSTAWSPDGARLAYTSFAGADDHLEVRVWTVSANGSVPSLVASRCCVSDGGGPVWSPDSSRITFEAEYGGGTPDVRVDHLIVDADGTGDPKEIDELVVKNWAGGWYFCACYG